MANKFKKAGQRAVDTAPRDAGVIRAGAIDVPAPIPTGNPNGKYVWGIVLGLLILISVIYFQTAGFEFVSLDDQAAVSGNTNLNKGFSAEGVRWAFSDYRLFYWQPLTYLSHMAASIVFGANAGGHHVINVIIHGLNAVLLFFLLLRLTGALWRSTAVATLFAIHPLAVETVAWVTERNNLLSTLFSILTLLAYIRYTGKPSTRRFLPVILASVLAVMSKPMAVSIPLALLLLDWWPLRRLTRTTIWQLCREKTVLFAVAAASVLVTMAGNSEHLVTTGTLPLYIRLSGALVAYARYLSMFLWPDSLGVFYQYMVPQVEHTAASILALTLLTIGAFSIVKRFPYVLFGWCWYLLMLVPVSGIFQVGGQGIADRFTYWPFIGIYVAFIWGVADLLKHWNAKPMLVAAASVVLVVLLTGKSWLQTGTWRDSVSLYSQALDATGGNEPMHRNLAVELAARGRTDAAVHHFRQAIRFDPGRIGLHYTLGRMLSAQGQFAEAAQQFSDELRLNPEFVPALKDLGFIYMRQNRLPEAAALLRHVLRNDPTDPDIKPMRPIIDSMPEKAQAIEPPETTAPAVSLPGAIGPYGEAPLWSPALIWNVGMVLACVGLGILVPHFGQPVFEGVDGAWRGVSRKRVLSLALVAGAPLVIRLLILPIHPVPKPAIHDEFGYLLIADTLASGRLTNPTPEMWRHFQTHYVFFEPTYTAKYPFGEPVFMAAAQVFGLPPWMGVWLSVGLMCAAVYWMLGGWLPARWALLGALIAAFRFGIGSYWMNSYWGGAAAALGGALVLGALPRIRRQARVGHSLLLGTGLLLLANTRPYEGFLLSIPVAVMLFVWLFSTATFTVSIKLRQVVLPLAAILVVGFAFDLYYNWRVTGDALLMPYKHNQKIYGTPTPFYFEPALAEPPALEDNKDLRDNFLWQRAAHAMGWPLSNLISATGTKLGTLWSFYFQPALTIPLLFLPLVLRNRRLRPLLLAALFVICGITLYPFYFPHYTAPIFAILLLVAVQGLRHLRMLEWNRRPVGAFLFHAMILILLCSAASELLSPRMEQSKTGRSETLEKLAELGGKHLILVRYSPQHIFHFAWIYNSADIDASQVIWARELDRKRNDELISHYRDRQVWLMEVDLPSPHLSPYPGTGVKRAGL